MRLVVKDTGSDSIDTMMYTQNGAGLNARLVLNSLYSQYHTSHGHVNNASPLTIQARAYSIFYTLKRMFLHANFSRMWSLPSVCLWHDGGLIGRIHSYEINTPL